MNAQPRRRIESIDRHRTEGRKQRPDEKTDQRADRNRQDEAIERRDHGRAFPARPPPARFRAAARHRPDAALEQARMVGHRARIIAGPVESQRDIGPGQNKSMRGPATVSNMALRTLAPAVNADQKTRTEQHGCQTRLGPPSLIEHRRQPAQRRISPPTGIGVPATAKPTFSAQSQSASPMRSQEIASNSRVPAPGGSAGRMQNILHAPVRPDALKNRFCAKLSGVAI